MVLALAAADKSTSVPLPDGVLSVAAYRAWFDDYAAVMAPPSVRPRCRAENIVLEVAPAPVGLRIYTASRIESIIVFAHGGGWMMGGVETHDHICRWLAVATNSRIISARLRLAPGTSIPFAVVQMAHVLEAGSRSDP
jgi:acetyl esterase